MSCPHHRGPSSHGSLGYLPPGRGTAINWLRGNPSAMHPVSAPGPGLTPSPDLSARPGRLGPGAGEPCGPSDAAPRATHAAPARHAGIVGGVSSSSSTLQRSARGYLHVGSLSGQEPRLAVLGRELSLLTGAPAPRRCNARSRFVPARRLLGERRGSRAALVAAGFWGGIFGDVQGVIVCRTRPDNPTWQGWGASTLKRICPAPCGVEEGLSGAIL